MTAAEALARLEFEVAPEEEPTLSPEELADLLRLARVPDADGHPPDSYVDWEPGTKYAVGDLVVPLTRNGHFYEVSAVGGAATTGADEPVWPAGTGAVVVDGNVTWEEAGTADWTGAWDLAAAAAAGWRRKAGKAAGTYKFTAAGGERERKAIFESCLAMAREYGRGRLLSVQLNRPGPASESVLPTA